MNKYSEYKDSGIEWIGEIPVHWTKSKLKYFTSFHYGYSLQASDRIEGNIPVYGSNGITGYHNLHITSSPCIIVGRKGSNGKINYSEKECFPIDTTYFIDENQTQNNLRFTFYLLSICQLDKISKDTGVPGLSREDAYNIHICYPSDTFEQISIADYLDRKTSEIDTLINQKKKLIELLKEERTATINQAVTKGLNPSVPMKDSGIEWLGQIPEHWEVKKLKYVANLKSGDSINSEQIQPSENYPVYGGNGLRGYFDRFTHDGNFVLIGRQGALCGNINFVQGRFWASEHAIVCTILHHDLWNWLGYSLICMNLNQYSQSAAQPGLSVDKIKNLDIPVPPPQEQSHIALFISESQKKIDSTINSVSEEIKLLEEYKTALISAAVTGKVDVRSEINEAQPA